MNYKIIFLVLLTFSLSQHLFAKSGKQASENLKKKCSEYNDVDSCIKVDKFCDDGDKFACVAMSVYWAGQKNEKAMTYANRAWALGNKQSCDVISQVNKIDRDTGEDKLKRDEQARQLEADQNAKNRERQADAARIQAVDAISDFAKSMRTPTVAPKQTTKCVSTPTKNFKGELEFTTECN